MQSSSPLTTEQDNSNSNPWGKVMLRRSIFMIAAMAFFVLLVSSVEYENMRKDTPISLTGDTQVYPQEYFNIDPMIPLAIGFLPTEYYPVGEGSVIAMLAANRPKDIEEAQTALKSLVFLKGDKNPEHLAPVLVFNEGDLAPEDLEAMIMSTNRPIGFPVINFNSFPPGFDPNQEQAEFVVQGRKSWGYYQMIRFWITTIWKHPAIQRFDAVMRIDTDSCFREFNDHLPNFKLDAIDYHSQYVGVVPPHGAAYLEGMYDFITNWMKETKGARAPHNPLLFNYAKMMWETKQTLPLFRTNFELSRRSFMQQPLVAHFHDDLSENDPYPVFRHRWGDAILRYFLVSIFLPSSKVMIDEPVGYYHKDQFGGCSKESVENALKINGLV